MPELVRRVGAPVARWRQPASALEIERARARERWSVDQLTAYQITRLRALLVHAHDTVPFHRARMQAAGFDPRALRRLEDLDALPVLTKRALKAAIAEGSGLSRAFDKATLVRGSTTGSTGVPLEYFADRRCLVRRRGLIERAERWTGVRPWKRLTRLWRRYDHHSASDERRMRAGLLQWVAVAEVSNAVGSALGREGLEDVVRRIERFRPHVIRGYVSALVSLAKHVEAAHGTALRPERVVASAEYLSDGDRGCLERAFACKVHNLYGASEAPSIAVDPFEHEALSVFSDYYYVEVGRSAPGEPGPLLVTDLSNYAMPLIRYEIGDLAERDEAPPIDWPFPRLRTVHGRVNDAFVLSDGRRVFSHVWHIYFRDLVGLDRFEVVQTHPGAITVTFVAPGGRMSEHELARVRKTVHDAFPGVAFEWRIRDALPVGPGEKHRPVRSLVPCEAAA